MGGKIDSKWFVSMKNIDLSHLSLSLIVIIQASSLLHSTPALEAPPSCLMNQPLSPTVIKLSCFVGVD